jgi:hypothetical protein
MLGLELVAQIFSNPMQELAKVENAKIVSDGSTGVITVF